jgi:hypothetical protein
VDTTGELSELKTLVAAKLDNGDETVEDNATLDDDTTLDGGGTLAEVIPLVGPGRELVGTAVDVAATVLLTLEGWTNEGVAVTVYGTDVVTTYNLRYA